MALPSMPSDLVSRECVRIAGGYGSAAAGTSPAGGLDADNAGNLAMAGDLTVDGDAEVGGDLAVDGGNLTLSNAPSDSNALLAQGSSWTTVEIESTGTDTDARIHLKTLGATWKIINDESDSNKLLFTKESSSKAYLDTSGNLWILGDCSADSFTDRSPAYVGGDALKLLRDVKPVQGTERDGWAEVDHETIGPMRKDRKATAEEPAQPGRDLGKNIQLNSAAILELLNRIKTLEMRVKKLERPRA